MAHALLALFLIVGLAPGTGFAEAIGPEVNGVAEEFVAGPPNGYFADLARLVAHGRSPGERLKHLMSAITLRVGADGRQESRCQDLLCAGQATKQIVIGMVFEERFYLFTVLV